VPAIAKRSGQTQTGFLKVYDVSLKFLNVSAKFRNLFEAAKIGRDPGWTQDKSTEYPWSAYDLEFNPKKLA